MASHLKGVKNTTMTDEIRRALCKHNKDNPSLTQKQLQEWVHSNYGLQVSQATISQCNGCRRCSDSPRRKCSCTVVD